MFLILLHKKTHDLVIWTASKFNWFFEADFYHFHVPLEYFWSCTTLFYDLDMDSPYFISHIGFILHSPWSVNCIVSNCHYIVLQIISNLQWLFFAANLHEISRSNWVFLTVLPFLFQDSDSGEEDDGVSSDASRSPSSADIERSYSSEGSSEQGPARAVNSSSLKRPTGNDPHHFSHVYYSSF